MIKPEIFPVPMPSNLFHSVQRMSELSWFRRWLHWKFKTSEFLWAYLVSLVLTDPELSGRSGDIVHTPGGFYRGLCGEIREAVVACQSAEELEELLIQTYSGIRDSWLLTQ